MSKALLSYNTSIYCFSIPTRPVTLSEKEIRLGWHNLFLTNPCWLFLITLLSSKYLQIDGLIVCCSIFSKYQNYTEQCLSSWVLLLPPFFNRYRVCPFPVLWDITCPLNHCFSLLLKHLKILFFQILITWIWRSNSGLSLTTHRVRMVKAKVPSKLHACRATHKKKSCHAVTF